MDYHEDGNTVILRMLHFVDYIPAALARIVRTYRTDADTTIHTSKNRG